MDEMRNARMGRVDLIKRLIATKAIWRLNMMASVANFLMFGGFGVYLYGFQPQETTALIWSIIGAIFMGIMSVISIKNFIKGKKLLDFYMSEEVK